MDDTPALTTAQAKRPPAILCTRCGKPAAGGAVITVLGPGSGHNHQRYVLDPVCLRTFRHFLATPPKDEPVPLADADLQAQAALFAEGGAAQ